jgi:hypothetical protein
VTPLDARQRALAEEQERLRKRMLQLEEMIRDAPRIAEEEERRRRQELLARATQQPTRADSTLFDKRYDLHTGYQRRRRTLKKQRREARLRFYGLCLLFLVMLLLLYHYLQ